MFVTIFLCTFLLSGCSCLQKSFMADQLSRFHTKVNTGLGVAIVPSGLLLTSEKSVYLPVVVQLGISLGYRYDISKNQSRCNNSIEQILEKAQNEVKDIRKSYEGIFDANYYAELLSHICETSSVCASTPRRPKRFLNLLGLGFGLVGTGVSIANAYHLHKLDNKVNAINNVLVQLKDNLDDMEDAINSLGEANKQLYAFIHSSVEGLFANLLKVQCKEQHDFAEINMNLLVSNFRQEVKTMVETILLSSQTQLVHGNLISMKQLKKLIADNAELKGSILEKEPSLVYQIGSLYPVQMDLETFSFGFILEIPVVHIGDVLPLMNIRNVGFIDKKKQQQARIFSPEYFTEIHTVGAIQYLDIDQGACKKTHGIWFCPSQALHACQESTCLSALIEQKQNSNVSSCRLQVKQLNHETEIMSTVTGVLIRTVETQLVVYNAPYISHVGRGKIVPVHENGVMFFRHDEYSQIHVGSRILTSFLKPVQNTRVTKTFHVSYESPVSNLSFVPIDWTMLDEAVAHNERAVKSLHEMMQRNKKTSFFAGSIESISFFDVLTILICLIVFLFIIWCILKCCKQKIMAQYENIFRV